MKFFYDCFLAITLPDKFRNDFKLLLKQVTNISPEFEITDLVPHITIEYFGDQTEDNLKAVIQKAKVNLGLIKGIKLYIEGLGFFNEDDPFVFYLDVKHSSNLNNFVEVFERKDDLPFHAHMTVARMNSREAKKTFEENKDNLRALLDKINWQFEVDKLDLYIRDDEKGEFKIFKEVNI